MVIRETLNQTVPLPYATLAEFRAATGTASDNCGLVETSFKLVSEVQLGEFPVVITRTYSVADSCDNVSECSHMITYIKKMDLTCPPPIKADCEAPPPYATLEEFLAAGGFVTIPGGVQRFWLNSEVSDNRKCPETIMRVYGIEDGDGKILYCDQLVIVDDTEAPKYVRAIDSLIICNTPIPTLTLAQLIPIAIVTDNCELDPDFLLIAGGRVSTCPEVWEYIYTVRDLCDNRTNIPVTFRIEEEAPVIYTEPSLAVYCGVPKPYTWQTWTAAGGTAGTCTGAAISMRLEFQQYQGSKM